CPQSLCAAPGVAFVLSPTRRPPGSPLFPYTTLFRSRTCCGRPRCSEDSEAQEAPMVDREKPTGLSDAAGAPLRATAIAGVAEARSEEHTSELQSLTNLVCRLLLEKNNASHTRRDRVG